MADRKLQAERALGGAGYALCALPEGKLAVALRPAGAEQNAVTILDAATLKDEGRLLPTAALPTQLACSSDGSLLALTAFDGVELWDRKAGARRAQLRDGGDDPRGAAFLGGGLLVVGGTQRHWQLYSTDAKPRVLAASGAPRRP